MWSSCSQDVLFDDLFFLLSCPPTSHLLPSLFYHTHTFCCSVRLQMCLQVLKPSSSTIIIRQVDQEQERETNTNCDRDEKKWELLSKEGQESEMGWDEKRRRDRKRKKIITIIFSPPVFGIMMVKRDEKRKKSNFSYLSYLPDFCVYSKQPMEPLNSFSFMSELPLCLIPRLEETKSPFWRERKTRTQRETLE